MIVTLSGDAGSGKSTCAKGLASKLGFKHYSTGDLMRQIALEKGLLLHELSKIAENDSRIDDELDKRQIELGKNEDNFIIDGRLSAYFIPSAVKIFLTADIFECAKRIYSAKRESEPVDSIETAISRINERRNSEISRYMSWYNFNPYDLKSYDIIYDSTNKSIDTMINELFEKISDFTEQ